jgi:hypothetical protein
MMGMKENGQIMERETRIELATNSLEAWHRLKIEDIASMVVHPGL